MPDEVIEPISFSLKDVGVPDQRVCNFTWSCPPDDECPLIEHQCAIVVDNTAFSHTESVECPVSHHQFECLIVFEDFFGWNPAAYDFAE